MTSTGPARTERHHQPDRPVRPCGVGPGRQQRCGGREGGARLQDAAAGRQAERRSGGFHEHTLKVHRHVSRPANRPAPGRPADCGERDLCNRRRRRGSTRRVTLAATYYRAGEVPATRREDRLARGSSCCHSSRSIRSRLSMSSLPFVPAKREPARTSASGSCDRRLSRGRTERDVLPTQRYVLSQRASPPLRLAGRRLARCLRWCCRSRGRCRWCRRR